MASNGLLQCYNKCCGQKYKEEDNNEGVCVHHPGVPVFHDAMKGWSCCKKRSTDFTDFLNIPGCTTSEHNPVKPPEPEKPPVESLQSGEEIIVRGPLPLVVLKDMERPPDDLPYQVLGVKVAKSLSSLLAKLQEKKKQLERLEESKEGKEEDEGEGNNGDKDEEVPIGTECKNNRCDVVYVGPDTDFTTCEHHPGVPIFHDGRTSDFNEFQRQEGCATGSHLWFKVVKKSCRMDWHQTGSMVVVVFYAKASLPDKSLIEANPTNIRVKLTFDEDETEFAQEIKLHGVVDLAKSSVDMMGTKVEVKLKKADPMRWAGLHFKEK